MPDTHLDVTVRWARDHDPDGGVAWYESMPIILETYRQITPTGYWQLTVAEHAFLLRHALGLPVVPNDEEGD